MSDFSIDDLPDEFKDLIRQIMKNFENMDPNDFQNLFKQLNDPNFLELFGSSIKNLNFQYPMNEDMLEIIQKMMKELVTSKTKSSKNTPPITEEAYFEFITIDKVSGVLLVDVPGISEIRNIQWELTALILNFFADEDGIKYSARISFDSDIQFQGSFTTLLNGVFKLPYKIKVND